MHVHHSKPWFAARRFGYGAGLPIAWQGWVVLAVFVAVILAAMALTGLARVVGVVVAVVCLGIVAAARTEGGWHWHWGRPG